MKDLTERVQHLATLKNVATKIFKLDPTPSNILKYVATEWPNVCITLRATMLQDVAFVQLCLKG